MSLKIIPRGSRGLGGPEVSLLESEVHRDQGSRGLGGPETTGSHCQGQGVQGSWGSMGLMVIPRGPWHHFWGQGIHRDQGSRSLGGPEVFRAVHRYFPGSGISSTKFCMCVDCSYSMDLVLRH